MRPVKDSAAGCLCHVLQHLSSIWKIKTVFKDRSMSRSWVRIILCCSLLCSPDVLSKGKTVLSNWKVFPGKNPNVSFSQPWHTWEASSQCRRQRFCGSFLCSRASLQEVFALSVPGLVLILVRQVTTCHEKLLNFHKKWALHFVPSVSTLVIGLLSSCWTYGRSPLALELTFFNKILCLNHKNSICACN